MSWIWYLKNCGSIIASASFPNWQGESQTRTIDKLTADEFVNTSPNVAGGQGSASNFYRRAK